MARGGDNGEALGIEVLFQRLLRAFGMQRIAIARKMCRPISAERTTSCVPEYPGRMSEDKSSGTVFAVTPCSRRFESVRLTMKYRHKNFTYSQARAIDEDARNWTKSNCLQKMSSVKDNHEVQKTTLAALIKGRTGGFGGAALR